MKITFHHIYGQGKILSFILWTILKKYMMRTKLVNYKLIFIDLYIVIVFNVYFKINFITKYKFCLYSIWIINCTISICK